MNPLKYFPIVVRNVLRNKVRSLFTGASIAASLLLVVTLYSLLSHQEELSAESEVYNRVAILNVSGLAGRLPIAYVDRIRRMSGVMVAAPMSWFGGNYKAERSTFPQFGTDPQTIFKVYEELTIPPDQLAAWQQDKTGCVVGSILARNLNLKIGDKLVLGGNIYPIDLELTVRGIYDGPESTDRGWVLFNFQYMDDALKEQREPTAGNAGLVMLRTNTTGDIPQVMQTAITTFDNSDAPVKPMTEKQFAQSFVEMQGNVRGFIRYTTFAVVAALLCVAGNTMAMSLRERTREIALLKAVGFGQGTVLGMFLSEAVLIALLGGTVGVLGGKFFFSAVDLSTVAPPLGLFYIPWSTALFGIVLSAFIGLCSGIVPAWRAAHLSVVEGLRKVV